MAANSWLGNARARVVPTRKLDHIAQIEALVHGLIAEVYGFELALRVIKSSSGMPPAPEHRVDQSMSAVGRLGPSPTWRFDQEDQRGVLGERSPVMVGECALGNAVRIGARE